MAALPLEKADHLLRLKEVLRIVPVSRSGWWQGVKDGRFPAPVKLGPRTTAWKASSIRSLVENGVSGGAIPKRGGGCR